MNEKQESYEKLASAINDAKYHWEHACSYCETPLLEAISRWFEAEKELKELKVGEGYYKAILYNLLGDKTFRN